MVMTGILSLVMRQRWALQREEHAVLIAHLIMALGGNCCGNCSWGSFHVSDISAAEIFTLSISVARIGFLVVGFCFSVKYEVLQSTV